MGKGRYPQYIFFLPHEIAVTQKRSTGKLLESRDPSTLFELPFARNKYHSAKCYHQTKVTDFVQSEPVMVPLIRFDVFVHKTIYMHSTHIFFSC